MATWGPTGIAATGDDGYEEAGGWANDGVYCGHTGSSTLNCGLRWLNVTVPAGATVTSATITMHARSVSGTVTNVHGTFYGDDVDDAAAWSSTSRPSQVTQTSASQDFDPSAWVSYTDYSYDVAAIIAEIIARAGWESGQDIRIALLNDSSVSGSYVRVFDYVDAVAATRLTIVYTEGGAVDSNFIFSRW